MANDRIEIAPLDIDNYDVWAMRMQLVLVNKGQWKAVDPGTDVTPELSLQAKATIGLNVKDHHLPTIAAAKTAKEAWDALQAIYRPKNQGRIIDLRRSLSALRMQSSESVEVYIGRARQLWIDLQFAGDTIKEEEVVYALLTGLPKRFETDISILTHGNQATSINVVQTSLLQSEQWRALSSAQPAEDNTAFSAQQHQRRLHHRRHKGSGHRHPAKNKPADSPSSGTPASSENPHANLICNYCHIRGHVYKDCRKRQKDERKGTSNNNRHVTAAVAFTVTSGSQADTTSWIMDSGAQRHITPDRALFQNYLPVSNETVLFGNGDREPVAGTGDVVLSITVNNST